MFGGMKDMMAQLQQAQAKVEEAKARLDTITVEGKSSNGKVVAVVTGNRKVVDLTIDSSLEDTEEIADLVVIAMNDALAKAESVNEAEMGAAAKSSMPNIPGMGGMFGK
ncbi:MAG: YbaB/EbfC family nucleoid-associated protein [Bacteroidetes bacterium]|uniref:Nucleoid-associated protein F8C82_01655 n=1 Tax=Phaeocystidibacter marisrubri TaxID=1577780 RepID=A0A6L3ZHQ8_9FLAO|nr:YbaB/EbfC family nucleoid-associated protein [Phaeocystidibacter marisrubri]KAB2817128.1 YbaB/EbfC family nucleoid-associated protein [Phaeocystidibacter marisrubri]TNE28289.1 MAG: YbaB/EbfC family nucleoid-associated protein [Bacteroidota bacterium]GGH76744.1 hypothetical protein GCM10011318_25470 [Phaeocystidibacter marisrubri]